MALRYQSLELKHAPTPRIQHFALLAGMEAAVRGVLISTIPIAVYDAFGSAQNLSTVYFTAGVVTLFWGLMVPRLTQIWPRRWVYSGGCTLYLVALYLHAYLRRLGCAPGGSRGAVAGRLSGQLLCSGFRYL